MNLRLLPAFLLAAFAAFQLSAQTVPSLYDYARPALEWQAIDTEHFQVIFHIGPDSTGAERTAREVARMAEEIYGPVTELYGHEPDSRVSIIIKDFEDYSNGAAYFFDNKIEIWAPALDSRLRGDHDWLQNVITHEFTHIVQVQASMAMSRHVPLAYLQVLDYESVRRPDVLSGYLNVIASYPLSSLNNPAWFAEGTAQYQRQFLAYDRWDSHRDMMLRTRVLAHRALTLSEMGGFYSKSSLMREAVYNHGYAFTRYLAGTYGEDVLSRITRSLGKWRNWNVERAMGQVLGRSASGVYDDWMDSLRTGYTEGTRAIRASLREGDVIESAGFANYGPEFSPDGARLAYVSNQGQHLGRTSLYIRDMAADSAWTMDLGRGGHAPGHTCSLGHRLRKGVSGSVTWRPDGEAIVYVRRRTTAEGFLYDDLYEMELAGRQERRITRGARASQPAYAPDGAAIAYVAQKDGTTNLHVLDVATGSTRPLTAFDDGRQVSEPAWHPLGTWLYFGMRAAGGHERDLWRVHAESGALEKVLGTPADERSPAFAASDTMLHFASDHSGIFNLYRLEKGGPVALTNVVGGAFMPAVSPDGTIAYAHYRWDGYKIALLSAPVPVNAGPYQVPHVLLKEGPGAYESGAGEPPVGSPAEEEAPADVRRYGMTTTGFTLFPVVRFDQFVSRRRRVGQRHLPDRTRAQVWARNLMLGSYVGSREVLEGISLTGALLVAPGSREASSVTDFLAPSRLLSLERQAFLLFDYKRGLGFLPRRWSPQLSMELFNIRRNVDSGLAIEEFPCTACFPDTTFTDLTYALWEANVYSRSKVSDALLLEVGYRYSPYRVIVEGFYSREARLSVPASSSRYFIGRALRAKAYLGLLSPYRESDILPRGLQLEAGLETESGRLLERFDLTEGILTPVYQRDRILRLTTRGTLGMPLPGRLRGAQHGAQVRWHASGILGKDVDGFYDDYVGGLSAARGYPFYALGGNRVVWAQASYFAPLFPDIRRQFLWFYLDKAFVRMYADAAAAWNGKWPGATAIRKDVGVELRLKLGSYYLFPTALFLSATYGMDSFDLELDEDFVTPTGNRFVHYGSEVRWHFGMLFGFDAL